ncbi:hypothetical protein [Deinococcus aerolatus]|nr:hypothetical protein [Deinococcus aerolatus]
MIRLRFLIYALLAASWFAISALTPLFPGRLATTTAEVSAAGSANVPDGCAFTLPQVWLDGTPLTFPHGARHLNIRDAISVEMTSLTAWHAPPLAALLKAEREVARRDPGISVTVLHRSARSFVLRFERPIMREVRYLAKVRSADGRTLCQLDVYEYDHDPDVVSLAQALLSSFTAYEHAELTVLR